MPASRNPDNKDIGYDNKIFFLNTGLKFINIPEQNIIFIV